MDFDTIRKRQLKLIDQIQRVFKTFNNTQKKHLKLLKKLGYFNILTVPRNELDLTNQQAVNNWFDKNKPEIRTYFVDGKYVYSVVTTESIVGQVKQEGGKYSKLLNGP